MKRSVVALSALIALFAVFHPAHTLAAPGGDFLTNPKLEGEKGEVRLDRETVRQIRQCMLRAAKAKTKRARKQKAQDCLDGYLPDSDGSCQGSAKTASCS